MSLVHPQVAVYARVSSHRQQKRATIDSQLAELRARVVRDGLRVKDEHILVDDGHSGSYLDRLGLDRLRDLVRDQIVRRIYVSSPDRLARRYAHQVILLEEFDVAGCEVVFLNRAPSSDPEGQLLVQVQGVIAEYERAKMAERLRRGKLHRARQGVVLSATAPYGYRYVARQGDEPGRWEIDESEAEMVCTLFAWVRDEAISVREATKRLNATPWRPKRGGQLWSPSSVRDVLRNEAYIGISYYNRRRWVESDRTDPIFRKMKKTRSVFRPREEWITVPVPALVDEATFYRVQEQLKKNRAFSRRNLKRKDAYLLRCLVQCGVCGLSMVAHSHGKHTYYHCSGSVDPLSNQKPRRCPAPQVYAPDLDRIVWAEIRAVLRSPSSLKAAFESNGARHRLPATDVVEAELERLEQRSVDAGRQIQRLLDAYQKGLVRPFELARRRTSLEERIADWNRQRRQLEEQRPKLRETAEVMRNLAAFCRHVGSGLNRLGFDDKQKLLRKLIERVTVTAWEVRVKLAIPVSANSDLTTKRVHAAEDATGVLAASS